MPWQYQTVASNNGQCNVNGQVVNVPQMLNFAGNVLELAPAAGGHVIALSTTAWRSLELAQRRVLESHAEVIRMSIPTIERVGGGGVRCMLAEIHLPRRR